MNFPIDDGTLAELKKSTEITEGQEHSSLYDVLDRLGKFSPHEAIAALIDEVARLRRPESEPYPAEIGRGIFIVHVGVTDGEMRIGSSFTVKDNLVSGPSSQQNDMEQDFTELLVKEEFVKCYTRLSGLRARDASNDNSN